MLDTILMLITIFIVDRILRKLINKIMQSYRKCKINKIKKIAQGGKNVTYIIRWNSNCI